MAEAKASPKWVQPVVDYTGLLTWGLAYLITRDLADSSWGLAIGSVIGLAVGFIMQRRLAMMPLVTGISAVIFASLTLIFDNDFFIKIKLTVIDGILAALLLGGVALGKQPLKAVLGEALKLSDRAWRKLTIRYGVFFAFLAIANEIVRRNVVPDGPITDDQWMILRTMVVPAIAIVFSFLQIPLIMKEMKTQEAELPPVPPSS